MYVEIEILWVVLSVLAAAFLLFVLYFQIRKGYAKRKVAGRSREEKITELNKDLEPFGFVYDDKQDTVYSGMYPWQRELGYCRLYDKAALALNMAIHSEPIYFEYNNRRWLIEFWKGQYGMTTGGEVGIYVTDKEDISIPGVFEGPFFECVTDEERITMEYLLYRKQRPILFRKELHWWLTGFDVGVFSKPKQLSMEIRLTFPNRMMLNAFLRGLEDAGYDERSYQVVWNTVQIYFDKPKAKQPYRKVRILFYMIQGLNRFYCMLFRRVTKNYIKTLDKIDYLRFLFPGGYRMLTGFAKTEKMQEAFRKIKQKAEAAQEVDE